MRSFTVLATLAAVVVGLASAGQLGARHHGAARSYGGSGGGAGGAENYGPPSPYEFSYSSQDPEGSHSRSESSDGKTVRGHYMIQLADGSMRKVEYHADERGFYAHVKTNELGTESKNPADAVFESTALTGEQAALQFGSKGGSRGSGSGGFGRSAGGAAGRSGGFGGGAAAWQ